MIGDNLEIYTFEYLMGLALSSVNNDLDRRQGSIIYDALAPFCQVLAAGALELKEFCLQTYAMTATGQDLDNRVAEQGIHRYAATHAVRKVALSDADGNPMSVPLGTRFSTISNTNPINYAVTAPYVENGLVVPGVYEATCEEEGTVGNQYSGNLINITFIQGLATAYMSATLVPARNEETDDEVRERYFDTLNQKAFSGNHSDYKAIAKRLGAGDVQIYPVWNGGGTVKLSIVDPSYGPCSEEFVEAVQQQIDPENSQGVRGTGIGLAPIGHQVTVVTPQEVDIAVSATVTLAAGYSLGQVETSINQALTSYIQSLRKSWANETQNFTYECSVFVSQVTATLIGAP